MAEGWFTSRGSLQRCGLIAQVDATTTCETRLLSGVYSSEDYLKLLFFFHHLLLFSFFFLKRSSMLLVYDLQRQRGRFGGAGANRKPHGWAEDNTGHLLSVCFLWCAATKRCRLPEHPGVPTCVAPCPGTDGARWSTSTASRLRWWWGGSLRAWQRAGTIAAVFEGQGCWFFLFFVFLFLQVT